MEAQDVKIKVGSIVEVWNVDTKTWRQAEVTRTSAKFIWFDNSGYARIAKTTIVNYPQFYRISKY